MVASICLFKVFADHAKRRGRSPRDPPGPIPPRGGGGDPPAPSPCAKPNIHLVPAGCSRPRCVCNFFGEQHPKPPFPGIILETQKNFAVFFFSGRVSGILPADTHNSSHMPSLFCTGFFCACWPFFSPSQQFRKNLLAFQITLCLHFLSFLSLVCILLQNSFLKMLPFFPPSNNGHIFAFSKTCPMLLSPSSFFPPNFVRMLSGRSSFNCH